jgi:small subunit ribosomal protein S8
MTLMLTDPISDYLTRVRNAIAAQHAEVEIPSSRLKREMSRILDEQGYIEGFSVEPTPVGDVIKIQLKYTDGRRWVGGAMLHTGRFRG